MTELALYPKFYSESNIHKKRPAASMSVVNSVNDGYQYTYHYNNPPVVSDEEDSNSFAMCNPAMRMAKRQRTTRVYFPSSKDNFKIFGHYGFFPVEEAQPEEDIGASGDRRLSLLFSEENLQTLHEEDDFSCSFLDDVCSVSNEDFFRSLTGVFDEDSSRSLFSTDTPNASEACNKKERENASIVPGVSPFSTAERRINPCANESLVIPIPNTLHTVTGERSETSDATTTTHCPTDTSSREIILTDLDVLFGRGQGRNKHPGNERFRKLVEEMKPLYAAQGKSKKKKNAISKQVLESVYAYGGRFLEIVDDKDAEDGSSTDDQDKKIIFIEVDEQRARKKCSQRLRETR